MKNRLKNNNHLIEELKLGNETAYKFLFKKYYAELFVYANMLTHDDLKADDLIQESMIKIWEQRAQLDIHTSLKNYLFKIVYHKFLDDCRKQKSELNLIQKLSVEALRDTWETDESKQQENIDKINKLITTLPNKCRKIFLLSKKEGLSYKEIAALLNISVKTVESQMGKAFGIIRAGIKN